MAIVLGVAGLMFSSSIGHADVITTDPDSFAVLSGGTFGADRDVRIDGSIGADGSMWLGSETSVTGNAYTDGGFSNDAGASVGGRVVARQGASIDRGSSVGSIDAGANVWVGRDTSVNGSIEAGDGLSMERSVRVAGDARYNGSYWADSSASISGAVTSGAAPDQWDPLTLTNPGVSTSGGSSLWFGRGSTQTLSTGDFGSLSADRDVTLHLGAGEYNFSSLWLGRDSRLVVDTSAGDVTLNVAGSFSTDRGFVVDNTGPGNVLIQAGGSLALDRDSSIEAQLRSYGSVSVDRDSLIDGSLHAAGNIWLDQGVQVTGAGAITGAAEPVPEPASVALFMLGAGLFLTRPRLNR